MMSYIYSMLFFGAPSKVQGFASSQSPSCTLIPSPSLSIDGLLCSSFAITSLFCEQDIENTSVV